MKGKILAFAFSALALCAGSAARAQCQFHKIADLPVTMAGLRPLVSAKINGKEALFLMDSGAFYSMLTKDAAAKYGVPVSLPQGDAYIEGVGGREQVRAGKVAEFTYLGVPLKNVDFLVAGEAYAPGAAGLIGQNLLRGMDVEFDLANGVIRLFSSKGCGDSILAYWAGDKALSILTIEPQSPMNAHVVASSKVDGRSIKVMFDTGAPLSVLSRSVADQIGIARSSEGVTAGGLTSGIGSGVFETSIATFPSFQIGDEEIKNARLRVSTLGDLGADMLIGDDFFLSHRILISTSQHKLYFTYNGGPVFRLDGEAAKAGAEPATTGAPTSAATDLKTAEAYSRRASASDARRDYPAAIADFTRAIELEPKAARHYRDRAMARLRNQQAALALTDLDRAAKLKPDDPEILVARGAVRLALKDLAGARADFDAATKLAPQDAQLPLHVADAYAEARHFELALGGYDRWIDAHPHDQAVFDVRARRCEARALWGKELDAALADCNAVTGPFSASETMRSRALVLLRLGRYGAAITQYDLALRAQPKDAWSLYERGLAKLKRGQASDGRADLAAAVVLEPKIVEEAKTYGLAPDAAATAAPAKS